MKCSYCGTEYIPGSEKCSGCGAKAIDAIGINIEKKEEVNPPTVMENHEVKVNSLEQENKTENKPVSPPAQVNYPVIDNSSENKNLKIIIAFLIGIIACMLIFGVWYFVIRDDEVKKSDNDAPVPTEKEKEPDPDISKKNTISFLGFTLAIPDGFVYNMYDGDDYIQNDECIILYKSYELDYDAVLANKDKIINNMKSEGYTVKSFEGKNIKGHNYVVVVAEITSIDSSIPNVEYGYVFGDLKGKVPVFATITSSTFGSLKTEWFDYVAEFFSSAS